MPEDIEPKKNTWMLLTCPFCTQQMHILRMKAERNERTDQSYIKTYYICLKCDYRVRTQMPRKIAATIVDESTLPTPTSAPAKEVCEDNTTVAV